MIAARREFLTAFFDSLDANGVRYCLLRNYDNLYADISTDVDILVSRYSLERFDRCLRAAAARTGFRFVHAARYVNYSHVYWHPRAGFVRIDFETEVRWRLFTVLSAREVLDARVRHQEFFIPHPAHESVILFVASVWRRALSARYRVQLLRLHEACADKDQLRCALVEAFGPAGVALAALQPQAATAPFEPALVARLRRSLLFQVHRRWGKLLALARNTWTDAARLWQRLRQPAGVSLLFVSSNERPRNFDDLMRQVEFLFPTQKCIVRTFDLTGPTPVRWGWGLRWLRLRTLFKGGLFVRAYRLSRDAELPVVVRTHARYLYPTRTVVCAEDSAGRLYLGHVSTGFMATSESRAAPGPRHAEAGETARAGEPDFSRLFIEFISDILERRAAPAAWKRARRGLFCVLVGLDGVGKTTLARNLCELATTGNRFNAVRYFHWRPKVFNSVEFPLPEFQNLPRKAPLAPNLVNAVLSALRLAKNAALVNVAAWLRLRPLVRGGGLVLVDRYFYNYHLDPASVKFAGPPGLLARAEKFFPRPDLVIRLRAPAEILRRRKQELSGEEILRQTAVLDELKFNGARMVDADASQPPDEVARATMNEILKAAANVR